MLRTVADADRLRAAAHFGGRIVVMGMGLVGSEAAATLVTMGAHVTAVDPFPYPLHQAVPAVVGGALARRHARHGVQLRHGRSVVAVHGTDRVGAVELDDGQRVVADVVLAGLGAEPATELARTAGLQVQTGIITDRYGRTSAPDVYAAGDVVEQWVPHAAGYQRVEHWRRAVQQAQALAATLSGTPTATDTAPWFWSDQYDLHLEVAGDPLAPESQLVLDGDPDGAFLLRCVRDGHTVGVVGSGRGRAVKAAARDIAGRGPEATHRRSATPVTA